MHHASPHHWIFLALPRLMGALVTARAGDRFATLARRPPLKIEPEAVLRLINGKYPQGEPVPGELVKLIQ